MEQYNKKKLIPEKYDYDGLDYEIDYFELTEDENTECKSER